MMEDPNVGGVANITDNRLLTEPDWVRNMRMRSIHWMPTSEGYMPFCETSPVCTSAEPKMTQHILNPGTLVTKVLAIIFAAAAFVSTDNIWLKSFNTAIGFVLAYLIELFLYPVMRRCVGILICACCGVHHSDMATGDIVQTDAGIYKVDCTNGDNALIPDDSSVPFQEVKNVRRIWNRTTDGHEWVLECTFLIYSNGYPPDRHIHGLHSKVTNELRGDRSLSYTRVSSCGRTLRRKMVQLFCSRTMHGQEKVNLEAGRACTKVYVWVKKSNPENQRSEERSRCYESFKKWRTDVASVVRSATFAWCHGHETLYKVIAYMDVDCGVCNGPWSRLLLHKQNHGQDWEVVPLPGDHDQITMT